MGIVPEHENVEHTLKAGDIDDGGNDDIETPTLVCSTIVRGGDDNGDDSTSRSSNSTDRSSVYSYRRPRKEKKVKRIKKGKDHCKVLGKE